MKKLFLFCGLLLSFTSMVAQQVATPLFRSAKAGQVNIQVHYRVNLKHKYNEAYQLPEHEIARWLLEGALHKKITPYYYNSPTQASTLRKMTSGTFKNQLKYYDQSTSDTVSIRAADTDKLELNVQIITDDKRSFVTEQIQFITLFYFNYTLNQSTPLVTFRYPQVKKYLKKRFKKSIRSGYFEALEGVWYPALQNGQLTGLYQALDAHWYKGDLLYAHPENGYQLNAAVPEHPLYKKIYGKYIPRFNPDTLPQLKPFFTPVGKHKTRTTLWYKTDLRKNQNQAYNQGKYSLTAAIIKGVKAKKIRPYYYAAAPFRRKTATRMSIDNFSRHLRYIKGKDTLSLPSDSLHLINRQEFYTKDKRRNKRHRQILAFTLLIPKGTTSETQFGDLRFANVPYKQTIRFLKKLHRRNPQEYAWVTHFINKKHSSEIIRFSHPQGDYLENILQLYFPKLSLNQLEQKARQISLKVEQYLNDE